MKEQQQLFDLEQRAFNPERYLNKNYYNGQIDERKKQLIEMWRKDRNISIKKVCTALDIHEHQYYEELDRLGITYAKRPRAKRQKLANGKKPESSCVTSFKGLCDPLQLEDEITRIALLIDENAYLYRYSIELEKISE